MAFNHKSASQKDLDTMLTRLRSDFQLTIISVFGICTVLVITPFAAYRYLSGATLVGILDTLLVIFITFVVYSAWRTGNNERAGVTLVVINCIGASASAEMLGVTGLFWMSTAIVTNFFLTKKRLFAAVITLFALFYLVMHGKAFANIPQMVSFTATSVLLAILSFIIAERVEMQRQQLENLATRDPLTGLLNRRTMSQDLTHAVQSFHRHPTDIALLIIDIDHFKQINDNHGHDVGDKVLVEFTQLVLAMIRSVDTFYRYGGEEFLLLVPGASKHDVQHIAEKLRSHIEHNLRCPRGAISLGAAILNAGEDWHNWMARADKALYKAKNSGRNRVEIED